MLGILSDQLVPNPGFLYLGVALFSVCVLTTLYAFQSNRKNPFYEENQYRKIGFHPKDRSEVSCLELFMKSKIQAGLMDVGSSTECAFEVY